ncbi:MAG: tRNA epoxyqueuosine(34) reductase QueG, partial [Actinomycetota bacterium]
MQDRDSTIDYTALAARIKDLGRDMGFAAIGVAQADVGAAAPRLQQWLDLGRHGDMDYMARHAALRSDPQALVPGTLT